MTGSSETLTFLFTDIVGSTRMWQLNEDAMHSALALHDAILRGLITDHEGTVFSTAGDGVAASFGSASAAVKAAMEAQTRLGQQMWPTTEPLRVRMGLHTGEVESRDGDYFGTTVNRAARLMAVAHGGQVLVSDSTAAVVRSNLPPDATVVDLGQHRLRDLAEPMRVFQVVHPALPADFPPLRSLDAVPGNLPLQVTSFVGRENELKLITQLVGHRALVTLTGVGGVGKTRLAVQVAAEVAAGFPDGAWLCELAAVNDPSAVWTTLAATLSILPPPGRSVPDAVLDYLGPKRLLVVIDNCEHLLSAVAKVIDAISHRCRDVALIATSREGLAVAGEQIIAVPALAVAEAGADRDTLLQVDAVRLFCDRAVEASSNFAMTDGNAAHVAQLCRRLDGIPLAIELAAARVRSLPPEELVARLDQRFRLLTRGSRAALERQQTLRNTIDWSYDLLSEAERMALNRVSVFAGGWDLDAAEAVVGGDDLERSEVVDVLGQLVDKSLVDVAHTDGGARYRLLETIRQYAQERLEMSGGAASVRGRHLDHFLAVSEQMGPRLRGREQLECSALLSRDADNLRAALDWAVEASLPDQGLRLVVPLQVTGIPIGWTANDWAETAASIEGAPKHELYPAAVAYAALGTTMRGERDRAGVLVETALDAQARLATNHLWVHAAAGTFAFFQGDLDRARHHAETWVGIARASKDPFEVAQSLILLAAVITTTDPTLAITVAEEAVHISRDADIPGSLIYALLVLGPLILEGDEPDRAVAVLDEAAQVASELGDRVSVATAHMSRAQLALAREDWPAALQTCALAADQQLQVGQMVTFGAPLSIGYVALAAIGRFESAAILMGLADRFPLTGGLSESLRSQAPAARTATLQALGTQRFEQLSGEGAKLSPAEAVAILRTEADTTLSRNAPADR